MLLIGASGVQCGSSRGAVCFGPAAVEMDRSAFSPATSLLRLLSRCIGLLGGIENVREGCVGSFVARSHLVVLVLFCLRAALRRSFFTILFAQHTHDANGVRARKRKAKGAFGARNLSFGLLCYSSGV